MNLTLQQRTEATTWQTLDRIVTLTHRERRLERHIRHCCTLLRDNREEQRRLKRGLGFSALKRGHSPMCAHNRLPGGVLLLICVICVICGFNSPAQIKLPARPATAAAVPINTNPPTVSVTLQWDASPDPDAAGYWLSWSTNADRYNSTRVAVGKTTAYTVRGLPPGQAIYFDLEAVGDPAYTQPSPRASLVWRQEEVIEFVPVIAARLEPPAEWRELGPPIYTITNSATLGADAKGFPALQPRRKTR